MMAAVAAVGLMLAMARYPLGAFCLALGGWFLFCVGFGRLAPATVRWLDGRHAAWAELGVLLLTPIWVLAGVVTLMAGPIVAALVAVRAGSGR